MKRDLNMTEKRIRVHLRAVLTIGLLVACLVIGASGLAAAERDGRFGLVCPWGEIGQTGVSWCRCGGGATRLGDWPRTETEDDVYDWRAAERELVNQHWAEGLIPAPIISYTPDWASSAPEEADRPDRYPPRDYADYAEILAQYAFRFRGRVPTWEVWNEPNIGFFHGTIPQYAELLKVGSIGANQGDPAAHLVFGGTAGVDTWFIRRCYELGAGPYLDIMAVHPYQWGKTFNDGWFIEKLQRLRRLMDEFGDTDKTIWLNELGWTSDGSAESEAIQARLLVQCYVTALSLPHLGVTKVFWFAVKDWGGPGHGLYREDSSKKPAWHALRAMIQQLAHRPYLGHREAGAARIQAFGPRDGEADNVLVIWASGLEPVAVMLPVGRGEVTAFDIMGNPLHIEAVDGTLRLQASPAPAYLHLPAKTARSFIKPVPQHAFPAPASLPPRPLVAATVYPQQGTARPYFIPGGVSRLTVRIFNGTGHDGFAHLRFALGEALDRARITVPARFNEVTEATVRLRPPREAKACVIPLHIEGEIAGQSLPAYDLPVRIAAGPVTEFYANSHLEKTYYVEGKSGCANSVRFGNTWTYRLPVRQPGKARVAMLVGAHQARHWSVLWSQDGETWQPLYEGESNLSWHSAETETLQQGDLYLKIDGDGQQVREVVVTFGL